MSRAVDELPGLGPVMRRRLADIGVHDEDSLRDMGSVEAYARLAFVEGRPPSLNALYAMEAALQDRPWNSLSPAVRQALALEATGRLHRPPGMGENGDNPQPVPAALATAGGPASMAPCRESPSPPHRPRPRRSRTSGASAG